MMLWVKSAVEALPARSGVLIGQTGDAISLIFGLALQIGSEIDIYRRPTWRRFPARHQEQPKSLNGGRLASVNRPFAHQTWRVIATANPMGYLR
jgi:hypothetical protein